MLNFRTVNHATHIALALLLLAACKEPSSQRPVSAPLAASDGVVIAPVPNAPVDTAAQVQPTTIAPATAAVPYVPEPHEGCSEYIDGNASGMRAVRYLKPAELAAHPEKITDELPSLWILAEQGAPVSIADDFEHGISTEHRHMPDTLSIEVWIYAECADRKPYAVQRYGIWRTAEGSPEWRRR